MGRHVLLYHLFSRRVPQTSTVGWTSLRSLQPTKNCVYRYYVMQVAGKFTLDVYSRFK